MVYLNELRQDLLLDTVENYKACLRITKSEKSIVSLVIFQYLPYLSLNTLDLMDALKIENMDDIYPQNTETFTKLLFTSRNFLKSETETSKYSKVKNQLLKHIQNNYNSLIFDYNIAQKCYVKNFGQKDLSVYSYNGIPFLNNIQNQQFLSKFNNDEKVAGVDLERFSASVTNFIKLASDNIIYGDNNIELIVEKIQQTQLNFKMNDYFLYEQYRGDLFNNDLEVDQNIFLFCLLCQVNSVSYIYPEVIKLEGNALLRMKFIVYLILIKGLWIYDNGNNNLSNELRQLVVESDRLFINDRNRSGFRNNIFHYDIPSDAKYNNDMINTLVKHYLNIEVSVFEAHVDFIFDTFVEKINIMLFGEQKLFLESNVL